MPKRLLSVILVLAMLLALPLMLASCGGKGDKGDKGDTGADGVTPKLRINDGTKVWEVSYDEGATWSSLGVKATGTAGAPGSQITIGENGNWFIDGVDTGFKATDA